MSQGRAKLLLKRVLELLNAYDPLEYAELGCPDDEYHYLACRLLSRQTTDRRALLAECGWSDSDGMLTALAALESA